MVGVCVVSRVVNDDACAFSVEFHGLEACPAADTPCVGLLGLPNPPNGDAGAAPDCPGSLVVVVKSTVYPGFTDKMKSRYPGLRLLFSPEFLTEKNSIDDFETCNRVIMGGDEEE